MTRWDPWSVHAPTLPRCGAGGNHPDRMMPAGPVPVQAVRAPSERQKMSGFLWFLFAAIYIAALVSLGLATLRKGRYVLFFVGIFLPLLWIIGALIGPTPRTAPTA